MKDHVIRFFCGSESRRSHRCRLVQIKDKLLQLTDKRKEMIDKWEDRWEWLRLSKSHFLFY